MRTLFSRRRVSTSEPSGALSIDPIFSEERRKDAHDRLLKRIAEATGVAFPRNCIRHTAATNMTELPGFTSSANQLDHGEGMLANNYRISVMLTSYFPKLVNSNFSSPYPTLLF